MRLIALFLLFGLTIHAHAETNYEYIQECEEAAHAKALVLAQREGKTLISGHVHISKIKDVWYNPKKFISFDAPALTKDGQKTHVTVTLTKNILSSKRCGEAEGWVPSGKAARFIKECQTYATDTLRAELKDMYGANLDSASVKLADVDTEFGDTEYAWFVGKGKTASGDLKSLTVMTQKSTFGNFSCTKFKQETAEQSGASRGRAGSGAPAVR